MPQSSPLFSRVAAAFAALTLVTIAAPALAHTGGGEAGGFLAGFGHPIFGWDHVAAMVAVGLWGAILGAPAIWLLPVVFPLVMTLGSVAGAAGLPLPGVEIGIALSGVVLGLMVATAARPPLAIAAVLVGAFAVLHGYAHGAEQPESGNTHAYIIGFVIGTGTLHLAGIALGALVLLPHGRWLVRGVGVGIAAVGTAFLTGVA
jgi:urease accessory protein